MKRPLVVLIILLASVLSAGTTGKLAGRVKDQKGDPIPFANILLVETQTRIQADENGKYYILNIPPGTYAVKCSQMGFQAIEVAYVEIKLDLTTLQNFVLSWKSTKFEGIKASSPREVISDCSSEYIKRIKSIDELVALSGNGIWSNLTADGDMNNSAFFLGQVSDRHSNPIFDAQVSIKEIGISVETDFSGCFEISDFKPGTYTIVVEANNYRKLVHKNLRLYYKMLDFQLFIKTEEHQEPVIINPQKQEQETVFTKGGIGYEDIELKIESNKLYNLNLTGNLKGTVFDSNFNRIPNAKIVVKKAKFKVKSDENGNFSINRIPIGYHAIICKSKGFETKSYGNVLIRQKEEQFLNFFLNKK